jgi:hypothetical protein
MKPCVVIITATDKVGINSGRTRYRVECRTCDVVVHSATTGPEIRQRQHLEERIDSLIAEVERLTTNATAREGVLRRRVDALRSVERERDKLILEIRK